MSLITKMIMNLFAIRRLNLFFLVDDLQTNKDALLLREGMCNFRMGEIIKTAQFSTKEKSKNSLSCILIQSQHNF